MSQIMSRVSRERDRLMQEKCLSVLSTLLTDMDNKYCVDCDAKGPRWVSWNLGVFLCIRCAGIHRNLGVHISKVKSVNLDTWKPEQVTMLQQMGNRRARAAYEANLPTNFCRPQSDSALETFIRAKYEHNKYTAKDWHPPPVPKVNWDDEIEIMRRRKDPPRSGVPLNLPASCKQPPASDRSPVGLSSKEDVQKQQKNSRSSADADLLGLSLGDAVSTPVSDANSSPSSSADLFGDFLSAPVAPPPNNGSSDSNVSALASLSPIGSATTNNNNNTSSGGTPKSLSHDSIMALYGKSTPAASNVRPPGSLAGLGSMAPFSGTPAAFGSAVYCNTTPQSNIYGSQMTQLQYNPQMTSPQVGQYQGSSGSADSRSALQHSVPSQYQAGTAMNVTQNVPGCTSTTQSGSQYQQSSDPHGAIGMFQQASANTVGSLGAINQPSINPPGTLGMFQQANATSLGTFAQQSGNTLDPLNMFPQKSGSIPGTFSQPSSNSTGLFGMFQQSNTSSPGCLGTIQPSTNTSGSLGTLHQPSTNTHGSLGTLHQPSTNTHGSLGPLHQPSTNTPGSLGTQPSTNIFNQTGYSQQQQQQQFFHQMSQMSLSPASAQVEAPSVSSFLSNPFS